MVTSVPQLSLLTVWIQFNAAPKQIELQKRAYFHLKDLFKSFQYLIWFSTFEPILGCNDGFYVPTFVTMNTKQILAHLFATALPPMQY